MDTATIWKKFRFVLFRDQIAILSITCQWQPHAFARQMLTSLLMDEILPPWYVNWSTNWMCTQTFMIKLGCLHIKFCLYKSVKILFHSLLFNEISTFVGHLMPKTSSLGIIVLLVNLYLGNKYEKVFLLLFCATQDCASASIYCWVRLFCFLNLELISNVCIYPAPPTRARYNAT